MNNAVEPIYLYVGTYTERMSFVDGRAEKASTCIAWSPHREP